MPAVKLVFFLLTRLPPRSTLFPTRRSSDLLSESSAMPTPSNRPVMSRAAARRSGRADRSEEHTSELQSHVNLVCRLLLEKKKSPAAQHAVHNGVGMAKPLSAPANRQLVDVI